MKLWRSMSLLAAGALLVAACSPGTGASPAPSTITAVGDGEGQVKVLAWPGYVEDGTTSPDVDWISSFAERSSSLLASWSSMIDWRYCFVLASS